ncbi:hypothetical protein BDW22DRAFT_1043604 [Trametopsis cervina]|nr:hypothetical protein BDW22DRAFT_1043604 [Trametopsis cervina]
MSRQRASEPSIAGGWVCSSAPHPEGEFMQRSAKRACVDRAHLCPGHRRRPRGTVTSRASAQFLRTPCPITASHIPPRPAISRAVIGPCVDVTIATLRVCAVLLHPSRPVRPRSTTPRPTNANNTHTHPFQGHRPSIVVRSAHVCLCSIIRQLDHCCLYLAFEGECTTIRTMRSSAASDHPG